MQTKAKTLAIAMVAFAAGCAITASLFLTQPAQAEDADCRQADMPFNSVSDTLGGKDLAIKYKIPMCLMQRGYKIVAVDVESDQRIQVHYHKNY